MRPESEPASLRCTGCGFDYNELHPSEVPAKARVLANDYSELMANTEEKLRQRPQADVWSAVEYVAHVRDVLLVQRERIIVALVEDQPEPAPMHVDERAALAHYNSEPIDLLWMQFGMSTGLFADQFGMLSEEQLARTLIYNYPQRQIRPLSWVGVHVAHELVHHLGDARRSADALVIDLGAD